MRRLLLTTIALLFVGIIKMYAQQEPQFTHYMFDKLSFNPAAAGINPEYVNITGLYHDQWGSFHDPEGASAPITQSAEVDGAIHTRYLTSKNMYIGAGFSFLNDREGFISTTGFLLSGDLHFSPDFGGDFSVGINAGMVNKAVAPNWKSSDLQDPYLPGTSSNYGFDAGVGAYYSTIKYYIGISALHLPATSLNWDVASNGNPASYAKYTFDRSYFLTGGYYYDIPSNPDLQLQPSFLLKQDAATTSFGISCLLMWKQLLWGGLNYRTENVTALAIMGGINLTANLKIGASYDIATSAPTAFGGTYEFFFNYRFKIKIPVEEPVWDRSPRFL